VRVGAVNGTERAVTIQCEANVGIHILGSSPLQIRKQLSAELKDPKSNVAEIDHILVVRVSGSHSRHYQIF
jgi:hypothetical protein